jgi:large subunit ribosomal protein L3
MTNIARRTGLITTKVGMTQIFTTDGNSIPVTLLYVDRNIVLQTKDEGSYKAVHIGYGASKNIKKPQAGLAKKVGIDSFRHSKEFRVTEGFLVNPGTELKADHFHIGQLIDVSSISIGKGFAGVMKKYGFRGLEASHGVSASHRSGGSTGQRQDPGKVFKGKKMPSHMGAKRITTQNLEIVDLALHLSLIAIKGAVPGHKGQIVYITDAIKLGYIPA